MALLASKPIGDPAWAALFLRIGLGFYFIALGGWGIEDFAAVSVTVEKLSGFEGQFLFVYSAVTPYALVAVGALLILGLWTVAAAAVATICIFPLLYSAGLFERVSDFVARRSLYKDGCVLGACIALMFTGGGILSLDRLMKADK